MKTVWIAALIAGASSALWAQNDEALRLKKLAAEDAMKAVDSYKRQTIEFVSGQLLSGPPVKGAPYSAEAVNETIQVLADGNRIVQRTSAMQYRDIDGREETSAMGAIFITDPVANARYTLHPDTKSADKNDPAALFNIKVNGGDVLYSTADPASTIGGGRGGPRPVTVAIRGRGPGDAPAQYGFATAGRIETRSGDAKKEDLGKMFIEGVEAQGTRITTTIPAGDIGNDRPISIVDERWYSPDLQMTVLTKHSDPRTGETSFQLKTINRAGPPSYLFEIPADYTVRTGPQPRQVRPE